MADKYPHLIKIASSEYDLPIYALGLTYSLDDCSKEELIALVISYQMENAKLSKELNEELSYTNRTIRALQQVIDGIKSRHGHLL